VEWFTAEEAQSVNHIRLSIETRLTGRDRIRRHVVPAMGMSALTIARGLKATQKQSQPDRCRRRLCRCATMRLIGQGEDADDRMVGAGVGICRRERRTVFVARPGRRYPHSDQGTGSTDRRRGASATTRTWSRTPAGIPRARAGELCPGALAQYAPD